MRKFLTFFATLLFFASVTVFTLPMLQNDANADLSLTEKVTIMAKAEDDTMPPVYIICSWPEWGSCWYDACGTPWNPCCVWTGYTNDYCRHLTFEID